MNRVLYGTENNYVDVTNVCIHLASNSSSFSLPKADRERAELFGDHQFGVLKHIALKNDVESRKFEAGVDCTVEIAKIDDRRNLPDTLSRIVVFVIAFNQFTYVKDTIDQLRSLTKNIVIVDNASSYPLLLQYYEELRGDSQVSIIRRQQNDGHTVISQHLRRYLPEVYALTDPDLLLNDKMPRNALDTMASLCEMHRVHKVGVALDISPTLKFRNLFFQGISIRDWEGRFWTIPIAHPTMSLFEAMIDTTLSVTNKRFPTRCIRIADDFTAIHRPWLIDNGMTADEENYYIAHKSKDSGCWIVDQQYVSVAKRDACFRVCSSSRKMSWWQNEYRSWEDHTFAVFDYFLDPDAIYVDIGAWIGPTVLYAATKARKIFAIEPDPVALSELYANIKMNDGFDSIITVIPQALDTEDGETAFGALMNLSLGDSVSSLIVRDSKCDHEKNNIVVVPKISMKSLLDKYPCIEESAFIKMDIEGGEKYVVPTIAPFAKLHQIPLLISLHWCFLSVDDIENVVDTLFETFSFVYARTSGRIWKQLNKNEILQRQLCDLLCTFETVTIENL